MCVSPALQGRQVRGSPASPCGSVSVAFRTVRKCGCLPSPPWVSSFSVETGQFKGSADDLRDGFIHLSTEEQVDGVIERFFSGKHPLYIAEFSGFHFLQKLKWETSASGAVYPHLSGVSLLPGEVTDFVKL